MPGAIGTGDPPTGSGCGRQNTRTIFVNIDNGAASARGQSEIGKTAARCKIQRLGKVRSRSSAARSTPGNKSDQVVKFLNDLMNDKNLLAQADEEEYFVCYVTEQGCRAWQEKQGISVTLPNGFTESQISKALNDDEPSAQLFEDLRNWRRRRADEEHVPPYCVFGDKTLRAIAALRPLDEDALAQISGVGAKKIEKYGDVVFGDCAGSIVVTLWGFGWCCINKCLDFADGGYD